MSTAVRGQKKFSRRSAASLREKSLGVQGTAHGLDWFTNMAARMGFGTPSLSEGATYELVRFSYNYWDLITLYRNHWISRRIVDTPVQDMVRAWPRLTSDLDPQDLTKIDRAIRRTQTKSNYETAMKWGRLFGGAGCLMVIDGHEHMLEEPLDLDAIEIGAYKGLLPFDRWAGITPSGEVCTDLRYPLDFNKPEHYEVRASGGASFKVHASRILRCMGPQVPTPEREAQSWWGISVIEPVFEEIKKRDNMSWNILSLTFRANILGMKFPDLAQLLSGVGMTAQATQRFEQRMQQVNHLLSNNSLVPLPADGSIESSQYSFSGLSECYQQFQLDISGAAQIPVTRLWGRTISGLGQSNDADERIYEERIGSDQETDMRPSLEKLYPVLCMSELGEVPEDLDLSFPSVRVLDETEKSELAKSVVDTVTVALNNGTISQRTAAKELKQSSDVTGIFTNITDEDIAKLPDTIQQEGELGAGLFGEEGGEEQGTPQLSPSSGPQKVLKETAKEHKEQEQAADANFSGGYEANYTAGEVNKLIRRLKEEKGIDAKINYVLKMGTYGTSKNDRSQGFRTYEISYSINGDNRLTNQTALSATHAKVLLLKGILSPPFAHDEEPDENPTKAGGDSVPSRHELLSLIRGVARDVAEFKESQHPRDDDGKFAKGSGGGGAASSSTPAKASVPKGMEHLAAQQHKTVASFCYAALAEGKWSNSQIAQAAQAKFGGKTTPESVAWYKMKAKKQATDKIIAAAPSTPKAVEKATEIGKASLFAKVTEKSTGTTKFVKLDGMPANFTTSMAAEYLQSKGYEASSYNISNYDPKKPAPPAGTVDLSISSSEAAAAAKQAEAKAKAATEMTNKSKKIVTSLSSPLTVNEIASIKSYTNGAYSHLNKALRHGKVLTLSEAVMAKQLDAAIHKSKLDEPCTLWRGIGAGDVKAVIGDNPKVGDVVMDNGFMSSSKRNTTGFYQGAKVQLKINMPAGAPALDVQPMSLHSGENEVVLPRGSMFKIKKLETVGGKAQLEVDYVEF